MTFGMCFCPCLCWNHKACHHTGLTGDRNVQDQAMPVSATVELVESSKHVGEHGIDQSGAAVASAERGELANWGLPLGLNVIPFRREGPISALDGSRSHATPAADPDTSLFRLWLEAASHVGQRGPRSLRP